MHRIPCEKLTVFSKNDYCECGHLPGWSSSVFIRDFPTDWARRAQQVLQLAMDWTVRESNPSEGGEDFPHPSRRALRLTQHSIQCVTSLSPAGKAAEGWR